MKIRIIILFFIFSVIKLYAYNYSEHKDSGDEAFCRLLKSIQQEEFFNILIDFLNIEKIEEKEIYFFKDLTIDKTQYISYGVLTALNGDHAGNPLFLEEQLKLKSSPINSTIIHLHNKYIAMGYSGAPDIRLARSYFRYLLESAANMSHFYEYGKSFQQQLRYFDKELIRQYEISYDTKKIFKKLNKTNSLSMYVTIHTLAISMAEKSAIIAKSNYEEAKQLLFYAFLFNSFADHLLADSFAAGHLVVNRTILTSLTNNRQMHNFYNKEGCDVVNMRGEVWHTYGDDNFNKLHYQLQPEIQQANINYSGYTDEAERIIQAVTCSISEVWNSFLTIYLNDDNNVVIPFIDTVPDEKEIQAEYFLQTFEALQMLPIPYYSDLTTLLPKTVEITETMQDIAKQPYYRDYVFSRISNSFVLGFSSSIFAENYFEGFDFRINLGTPVKSFNFNKQGGKKGAADYWMGYTIDYFIGEIKERDSLSSDIQMQQIKAGIRNNLDLWVGEKNFFAFSANLEAGAQFAEEQISFVFVPTIGFQPGYLFYINYNNMPGWLRFPLKYLIIPLKLRYSIILSPDFEPLFSAGIDLTILF